MDRGKEFKIVTTEGGKKAVAMETNGEQWLLLGSYGPQELYNQGVELRRLGMDLKVGEPFDWRVSIQKDEVVTLDPALVAEKTVRGMCVKEKDFDTMLQTGMRPVNVSQR